MLLKPPPQKIFVTAAALVICTIAIGTSLLAKRTMPERLIEFESNAPFGVVYRGKYIWDGSGGIGPVPVSLIGKPIYRASQILCRSITGGSEHVVTDYGHELALASHDMVTACADGVYFGAVKRPKISGLLIKASNNPKIGSIGSTLTEGFLGTFAVSNATTARPVDRSEKRTDYTVKAAFGSGIQMRRVPVEGGTSKRVCTVSGANFVLNGSHALWITWKPYTQTTVERGNAYWFENTKHVDLMWTDLKNGMQRCIYTGASILLTKGESGAIWSEPRAFPDSSADLYYARAVDGAVFRIGTIGSDEFVGWSAEFNGAVYYWILAQKNQESAERIMKVELGNAATTRVLDILQANTGEINSNSLLVYHGALYCVAGHSSSSNGQTSTALMRIRSGLHNSLEPVQTLQPNLNVAGIDDGFLYYTVSERKSGILARITGDDSDGPMCGALYRIRLPD